MQPHSKSTFRFFAQSHPLCIKSVKSFYFPHPRKRIIKFFLPFKKLKHPTRKQSNLLADSNAHITEPTDGRNQADNH
jgi:hypothetical protein